MTYIMLHLPNIVKNYIEREKYREALLKIQNLYEVRKMYFFKYLF